MAKQVTFCSSIGKWCRREFHQKNFSLVHHNFHLFVESQWMRGEIGLPYLMYRVVVALLFIVWPVLDLWIEGSLWYSSMLYLWLLFATNWSFVILSVSSFVSAVNVVRFYVRQRRQTFRAEMFFKNRTRPSCNRRIYGCMETANGVKWSKLINQLLTSCNVH